MAATKPRRKPAARTPMPRALRESYYGDDGPALRIDREKHVVYGVKVLGRYSPNSHDHAQASNGTEYTPACMKDALHLYEGVEVMAGHDKKSDPDARPDDDFVGVLRNCRMDGDCVRADLHYRPEHALTPRLLEDIERSFGKLGLSHDARAAKERFDPVGRRLVIEKLQSVASVDLVRKPATNRNLWESRQEPAVPKTLRELLESKKYTGGRGKLLTRLFEMDDMGAADAPMEETAGTSDEDALWSGFMAAINAIGSAYKAGELDWKAAGKKVTAYLKAHDSLTGDAEPKGDELEEEEEKPEPKKKDDDDSKKESVELAALRTEKGVRKLCESLQFTPTELQLEALVGVAEPSRRKLIESFKGAAKPAARPTSSGPGVGKPAGDPVVPTDAKSFAASLRD